MRLSVIRRAVVSARPRLGALGRQIPVFASRSVVKAPTFEFKGLRGFCSEPLAAERKEILGLLSKIIDPDLHKDIVTLGFVKNMKIDKPNGLVSFDLELTTPACPVKDQFVNACQTLLTKHTDWITRVDVHLTAQERKSPKKDSGPNGLSKVSNIIAVASCKGGVGKSSVATNLAFMLAKRHGVKVGLLDADIYGPSLPFLVPSSSKAPFDPSLKQQLQAWEHEGVKLMSMGFLRPGESIALRGPMVSGMIQQMLTMTGWGELDYLIIDMPPGTGDIQLTVGQHAEVDAAVVVTTPQQLSLVDVEKGVRLFDKLKIPSVAVVENMAYFKCDSCDKKHEIFSRTGEGKAISEQFGIENYHRLPLDSRFAEKAASSGSFPFVLQDEAKSSPVFEELTVLADAVIRGVSKLKFDDVEFVAGGKDAPIIGFAEKKKHNGEVVWEGQVAARDLRLACKSAAMYDEWTGAKLFKEEDIPQDVTAKSIERAGRYAIRVEWTDGHSSIFPNRGLKELCGSKGVTSGEEIREGSTSENVSVSGKPREARI